MRTKASFFSSLLLFVLFLVPEVSHTQEQVSESDNKEEVSPAQEDSETRELRELADKVVPAFVFIEYGSGVCISPDGYILTNHHVASRAVRKYNDNGDLMAYRVRLAGKSKKYNAFCVGADPRGDIVLMKLELEEGEEVPYVEFADSDKVEIGDLAFAVGNPFLLGNTSFEPTISYGVVSAQSRYQSGYSDCIQIDAALNPGNSGGPTFNFQGELIGINGRIMTRHRRRYNTGAGYAIPINQIKRFMEPFKRQAGGAVIVRHGLVSGLAIKHDQRLKGVEVLKVQENSEAAQAGFAEGDLIHQIEHYAVNGVREFYAKQQTWPFGSELHYTLQRGEESLVIRARLDVPVQTNQSLSWPFSVSDQENAFIFQDVAGGVPRGEGPSMFSIPTPKVALGMRLERKQDAEEISNNGWEVKAFLKDYQGEYTEAQELLELGDILTHFNGRRILYREELNDCLLGFREGENVELRVLRKEQEISVNIKLVRR